MNRLTAIVGLTALTAASFDAAPAVAVTPVGAELVTAPTLEVEGIVGSAIGPNIIHTWTGTPAPLDTQGSAEGDFHAPTPGNPIAGFEEVGATGSATWDSAASGSVSFDTSFQIVLVQQSIQFFLPVGYGFNSGWNYSFTPATDATFTVNYDVDAGGIGVGDDFGGWFIQTSIGPLFDSFPTGSTFVGNGSGVFTEDLMAGQTYTMSLFAPPLVSFDNPVVAAGDETAQFDWSILESSAGGGAVPEPSTWAMLLIGFAGLGFVRYRASRKSFAFDEGRK